MITALIFAGGTGHRMNTRSKPKQFLELHGKPIIIYTLEHFEHNEQIDKIVIVCLESWITELEAFLEQYHIRKVVKIVAGGETGHASIYNGLTAMKEIMTDEKDIVLIHDGVRPLINSELIDANIEAVKKYGSAITSENVRESVVHSVDGNKIEDVPPRNEMYVAKAPQSFFYKDIMGLYNKSHEAGIHAIDSAHLCSLYKFPIHMVKSTRNNLKITEPADYYIFRAIHDAIENEQIFGL